MDSNESNMLVATFAQETERHVEEVKFLKQEIKTLIGAIRTAPDLQSLRVVANESVERMRKRALEEDKQRLRQMQNEAASTTRVKDDNP